VVKRGWIAWDHTELPRTAFEARLKAVSEVLNEIDLPALVIYTDVWRSNHARQLVNFMPYWNRSLLVIPCNASPILICALSPRVYPWIRSISVVDDIRPGGDPGAVLLRLCADNGWNRIGVVDLARIPSGIFSSISTGHIQAVDVPARKLFASAPDEYELSMRKHAATMVREILAEELPPTAGGSDYRLVGNLEKKLRRAGAEDLVILLTDGEFCPLPPCGSILDDSFSVAVALEYRGHWVRVSRSRAPDIVLESLEKKFTEFLHSFECPNAAQMCVRDLRGSYPFEFQDAPELKHGSMFACDLEFVHNGRRLFYGDTCIRTTGGAELL
jgi:hypothetical protein